MSESQVTPRFKAEIIRSKPHLHLVSYCGCVVPGCRWWHAAPVQMRLVMRLALSGARDVEPNPHVSAHHVRRANNSGAGVKPGDECTAGLCNGIHHHELHLRGERTCSAEWGIDLMEEAARLAAAGRMLGFLPAIAA